MNPSQSWLSANIKSILSLLVAFFTYSILFTILWMYRGQMTIVSQILIGTFTSIGTILGYYYGYSQGASKKDEAAANQLANSQVSSTTTTTAPVTSPSGAGEGG